MTTDRFCDDATGKPTRFPRHGWLVIGTLVGAPLGRSTLVLFVSSNRIEKAMVCGALGGALLGLVLGVMIDIHVARVRSASSAQVRASQLFRGGLLALVLYFMIRILVGWWNVL